MAKKNIETEVRRAVLIWTKNQFKEQIEKQIEKGKEVLNFDIPSHFVSVGYGYGQGARKVYDEAKFEEFKIVKNQWVDVTKEILRQAFDIPNNEYHSQFSNAGNAIALIGNQDWPTEYKKEVNRKIAALESLLAQLPFIQCQQSEVTDGDVEKSKKIFISHSSGDAEFARALVNLLFSIGFKPNEIFCSSVPGCWVREGKNFCQVIKEQFDQHKLYLIFIHSPRLYDSHVSMNEMGAAWVLQSEYSSFLTTDMQYGNMDAVVRNTDIAIKIDDEYAKHRMNEWKDRLIAWFGKDKIDENIWETFRDEFIKRMNQLVYPAASQDSRDDSNRIVKLTESDIQKLKEWVDSGDNHFFQVWYEGGWATFGLGAKNQHEVQSGREMAEWQGFLSRLTQGGFVNKKENAEKHPDYELTEKAYEYFDK